MKNFNRNNKPMKKVTLEEFCTVGFIGDIKKEKWISEEECIRTICELIKINVFDLDDFRWLFYYQDYCKVRKTWNENYK